MNEKDLLALKKTIDNSKIEDAKLSGQLEQLEKELMEKYSIKPSDVSAKIAECEEIIKSNTTEYNNIITRIRTTYGNII